MGHDLAAIADLDAHDKLRHFRDEFQLRDGLIYVDGNSLGALPRATAARVAEAVSAEWGEGLITSWLGAEWSTAPRRIGDKIASILGALPGEIIASDSTSVNIFKALTAAVSLRPNRSIILSESTNFPTDVYMMQGIEAFSAARLRAERVEPDALLDRLNDDVAVLLLTQVHYKSGLVRDMAAVTRRAHEKGVLVVWDLSHSAGALAVDLNGAEADLAVGCGYKYLNGGPGAPAFLFVAERHQAEIRSPLTGWMGHAEPFAFVDDYRPAAGIRRQLCGTPPILSLAALDVGIDLMLQADMAALERKAGALGDLFIALVEERCAGLGLSLASPRDSAQRGSHVVFAHPEAYAIMQALIERGVVGDFRAPDLLRFGFTPLYTRHVDLFDAAESLQEVFASEAHRDERFQDRLSVT